MKELVRKYGLKGAFFGALMATTTLSGLALFSQPAYAAECDCALWEEVAATLCVIYGHGDNLTGFACQPEFNQFLYWCDGTGPWSSPC